MSIARIDRPNQLFHDLVSEGLLPSGEPERVNGTTVGIRMPAVYCECRWQIVTHWFWDPAKRRPLCVGCARRTAGALPLQEGGELWLT